MSKLRFISPYFSSIGLNEALVLLRAILFPFYKNSLKRTQLHSIISRHYNGAACFSYTSARGALASCLGSTGIVAEDEVLLSSFSCLAVPTAVISVGAIPVYADIDPGTLNITIKTIKAALTNRTRAIVVQHTLGSFAPVKEIVQFARERKILIIEDCALSIGTKENNKEVGTFGDAAIFSMELSKTISVGWGGILIVNDSVLAKRIAEKYESIKPLHCHRTIRKALQAMVTGICYNPSIFWFAKYFVAIGFKLRLFKISTPKTEEKGIVSFDFVSKLSGPQTVLAIHQWIRFEQIIRSCHENGTFLRSILNELRYVPLGDFGHEYYSVSPRVSFLVSNRKEVIQWFLTRGVELGSWFDGPLSPLPNAKIFNYRRNEYPNSIFIAEHIVNIPCHSRLQNIDILHLKHILLEYASTHFKDKEIYNTFNHLISKFRE